VLYETIDLYAARKRPRMIVFRREWLASGKHRVVVHVVGTKRAASGGTSVNVDAFGIIGDP
jgi:hypothetical protein